jgi:RES domain-containing protein
VSSRVEELLARAPTVRIEGVAYQNQPPGFDPRSGAGARRRGGRFNPPNSFPVLYLALTPDTAAAELRRGAEGMGLPVAGVLPRELFRYDVDLARVLDLRDQAVRDTLGVTREELLAADRTRSHQIGEAASRLGVQAVVCPSATGLGAIVAVFTDNLGSGTCEPHLVATWETEGQIGTGA